MAEHTSIAVEHARAVAHPVRFRLVGLLTDGPRTVEALASELDTTEATVLEHASALREAGIVQAEEHADGSSTFELLQVPVIWHTAYDALPLPAKRAAAASAVTQISARATAAVDRGGFDRADIHLTRTTLRVDEEGWQRVVRLLDASFHELGNLAEQPEPPGDTFLATAALMLFTGEKSTADPAPRSAANRSDAIERVWELTEELAELPLDPDLDWERIENVAEQVRLIARGMQSQPGAPAAQLRPE